MGTKLSLNGLSNIYLEAIKHDEPTIVFSLNNGRGRFLFMMFFDQEDVKSLDKIYIFLQRTRIMLSLKMYGHHKGGVFDVYLNDEEQQKIIEELALENTDPNNPFKFEQFWNSLNSRIPQSLPLSEKIQNFRDNKEVIVENLPSVFEEGERTILRGIVRLNERHPRERTLRKLFLYSNDDVHTISKFIDFLKKNNMTLSWTNKLSDKVVNITELMK